MVANALLFLQGDPGMKVLFGRLTYNESGFAAFDLKNRIMYVVQR